MVSENAWHGCSSWCQTQASFDELAFLRLWHSWATDSAPPTHLHVVAHTVQPLQADALMSAAAPHPELLPLAQQLAEQCWGLLPGMHRLRFALNTTSKTRVGPSAETALSSHTSNDRDARLALTL